jgi:prefoldin subunit 5
MLKTPITKTALLAAVLIPSASMAIEDCETTVTESRMKQQIEDLQRQNQAQQQNITELLQIIRSSVRQKINTEDLQRQNQTVLREVKELVQIILSSFRQKINIEDLQQQLQAQQQEIKELQTALSSLRKKLEAISVTNNGNVGIGTASPEAKLEIAGNVKMTGKLSYGCPAGMANAGGYCIHTISPYPRGKNWWQALDVCIADGYRLCSQSEVVNAAKAGILKQYKWSEGDSWYYTASQAEKSPGASGENQVCDVQGNIDQSNQPQYSVQCQHEKSWTHKWRTTVCCY